MPKRKLLVKYAFDVVLFAVEVDLRLVVLRIVCQSPNCRKDYPDDDDKRDQSVGFDKITPYSLVCRVMRLRRARSPDSLGSR